MNAFPPVPEMVAAVRSKRVAPDHFVTESLRRLEQHGGTLGAVLSLTKERAQADLAPLSARLAGGEDLPLAGVPIAIKDNICVRGTTTTCGSRILESYRPPYDATAVERLVRAGAVIVAKTNLDEFAMGSSTENSAFFPAKNPWDLARVPGGSSGGSASVVAAALVPAALGSETGGSVRQPAAFTGIAGLKPTYGRVSRYGLVAFGSSLDQIGTFARTAADAALIHAVIAGRDPRDATSSDHPVEPNQARSMDLKGLRVGIPKEGHDSAIDARIRARLSATQERLLAAGAVIRELSLPHAKYAIPTYYIVATAEASSNLARHDGMHCGVAAPPEKDLLHQYLRNRAQGFGAEVTRRILLGTFCLSSGYYDAYYERAMRVRSLLARDYRAAFEQVDVLLGPTTPTPAFKHGEKTSDPLQMYLADVLTAGANLAGVPALSIRAGHLTEGGSELPIGLQLTGPAWSENLLFRVGAAIESYWPEADRLPPFVRSQA